MDRASLKEFGIYSETKKQFRFWDGFRNREIHLGCAEIKLGDSGYVVIKFPSTDQYPKIALFKKQDAFIGYHFCGYLKCFFGKDGVYAMEKMSGECIITSKVKKEKWHTAELKDTTDLSPLSTMEDENYDPKYRFFAAKCKGRNVVLNQNGGRVFSSKDDIISYEPETKIAVTKSKITKRCKVVSMNGGVLDKASQIYACFGGFFTYEKRTGQVNFVDKFGRKHAVTTLKKGRSFYPSKISEGCVQAGDCYVNCIGQVSKQMFKGDTADRLYHFICKGGNLENLADYDFGDIQIVAAALLELQHRTHVNLAIYFNRIRFEAQYAESKGESQARILKTILKGIDADLNLNGSVFQQHVPYVLQKRKERLKAEKQALKEAKQNLKEEQKLEKVKGKESDLMPQKYLKAAVVHQEELRKVVTSYTYAKELIEKYDDQKWRERREKMALEEWS